MTQNKQLWALRWSPVGYKVTYKAFIIAEDSLEANYFWNKYQKQHNEVHDTWTRARLRVQGYATFHPSDENEEKEFKRLFPRKRKAGVYLCDVERENLTTDHVND
ncbi:hypothetical protein [Butyrivibrio hungatei]|uniref:Uncharacterized protein n=1 Tax=Butyrivibrio hungatei TaxID=185008 RepID=A0A1D9P5N7_9FIRM|nr:hypothetical protein [Butyrivibrio hungatei]AOZ97936.1 hypothetical protein bhn_II137 [Butyrivibrio hungatei]